MRIYRTLIFVASIGFGACLFLFNYSFAQVQISLECYEPGKHVVDIRGIPDPDDPSEDIGSSYYFDEDGGVMTINTDSTAHITGILLNYSNPNVKWEVDVWLKNESGWDYWSNPANWTLPRGRARNYKEPLPEGTALNLLAEQEHPNWTYWELDNSRSRLIGLDAMSDYTLLLSHMPDEFQVGFQLGIAANDKNEAFGFSGWFFYKEANDKFFTDEDSNGDFNAIADTILDTNANFCMFREAFRFCVTPDSFIVGLQFSNSCEGTIIKNSLGEDKILAEQQIGANFGPFHIDDSVIFTYMLPNNVDTGQVQFANINCDDDTLKLNTFTECLESSPDSFVVKAFLTGNVGGTYDLIPKLGVNLDTIPINMIDTICIGCNKPFPEGASLNIGLYIFVNDSAFEIVSHPITKVCTSTPNTCPIENATIESICGDSGTYTVSIKLESSAFDTLVIYDDQNTDTLYLTDCGSTIFEGEYGTYNRGDTIEISVHEQDRFHFCFKRFPIDEPICNANGLKLLNLFPNPAQDKIVLETAPISTQTITWKIFSLNGDLLDYSSLPDYKGIRQLEIPIDILNDGIYLIAVFSENGFVASRPFIKISQ